MARIVLDRIRKVYAGDVVAVDDVSLTIPDGEFMVLVGPSGCGKSTLLRIVAGLEELSAGEVYIGDRIVTDTPPRDRDVAMVFQSYALYPHMTVEQNLSIGLRLRRMPKAEARRRVAEVAAMLGLESLLARKPAALSGGQRQRVAMGRAMVREPQAFLMDEPLSNLDAKLRVQMRAELSRVRDRLRTTTIYVTHDQVEAMTLGDRVAVMRDGVIQQLDTPQALYRRPANVFVAAFIGSPSMNLFEAAYAGGELRFGGYVLPTGDRPELAAHEGRSIAVGIRPDDLEDAALARTPGLPSFAVPVDVVEELGPEISAIFRLDARPVGGDAVRAAAEDEAAGAVPLVAEADQTVCTARIDAASRCRAGEELRLAVDPARVHYFDPATGLAIGDGPRVSPASRVPAGA